jgi:hypothetical protein
LATVDRLLFVWLYCLFPSLLSAAVIVKPDTIIRWHRKGFRLYWRWKSRCRGGRPKVPMEIRHLIREMSLANRLWGAPRIHGEFGIEVAQSTVAKYMAKRRPGVSGQTWKTFLRNHAAGIGAVDFLVVPTINFRLLFVLVILRHERRRLVSLTVPHPPSGSRGRSPRLFPGTRRRVILFGIAMVVTVPPSFAGCEPWEFEIIRRPHGHLGRTGMRRD